MNGPLDSMMESVLEPIAGAKEWQGEDGLPWATHRGVLKIGDVELECVQLSNGQRVFTEESVMKFFGAK